MNSSDQFDSDNEGGTRPTKEQVYRFTDPMFSLGFDEFFYSGANGFFSEQNWNDPYLVEEYMKRLRFEKMGWIFDTRTRKCRKEKE